MITNTEDQETLTMNYPCYLIVSYGMDSDMMTLIFILKCTTLSLLFILLFDRLTTKLSTRIVPRFSTMTCWFVTVVFDDIDKTDVSI